MYRARVAHDVRCSGVNDDRQTRTCVQCDRPIGGEAKYKKHYGVPQIVDQRRRRQREQRGCGGQRSGRGGRGAREMATAEQDVQDQIPDRQHHGGTAAGVLHRVQRAGQPDHAEPEHAEGVPRESEPERQHVHRAGETVDERQQHAGRGGRRPGAGHRHDGVAVHHTAHRAQHIRHIRRVVERPDRQA